MSRIFLYSALALLLLQPAAYAGEEELKNEIRELRKELADFKKDFKREMGTLKNLIRQSGKQARPSRAARPTTGKTSINGDPIMGNADAPLVLVEFSDYECPFCGRFFRNTMSDIKKNFVDTGKIRYVFKDFPLAFHKKAPKAAEAAHCAGEEGKFWQMHDLIFENQKQLDIPSLISRADKLGLNADNFKRCLDDGRYAEGIKKDIEAGKSSSVTGTPSFLLGPVNDKGEVEGSILRGAQPYESFKAAIDAMLVKVKAAK